VIASVIKLFKALAEVSRKVDRGLAWSSKDGEGLGEISPR
jgi:hypothetical protein